MARRLRAVATIKVAIPGPMLKRKPVFRPRLLTREVPAGTVARKSIAIMASIHSNDSPRSFPQTLRVIYSGNYAPERRERLDILRTVGHRV